MKARYFTSKKSPKSKRKSINRNSQSNDSAPTASEYAIDGGKQVLRVLESAAGWIPVPFIQNVFRLALKVVEACEDKIEIEDRVLQLQDRICGLMMAILDHITEDPDPDAICNAGEKIEDEIKILIITLGGILDDLNGIKDQHSLLLVFFKDVNKTKVDECMEKLTTAVERFNLSNGVYTADSLRKIQGRLEEIQRLAKHVSQKISNLDAKIDAGFSNMADALKGAKARKSTLLFARQPMPLKPRIFHGRDDFVEDVASLLIVESTSRVCILGPGGMGKTSLALAVVESSTIQRKFTETNRFWIPCVEATSINIFLQMLYTNLQITRDTKDQLNDILFELAESDEPRLILLDNFETPWNLLDGTRNQLNDILSRLARLNHVALLVTMRGTHPPTEDVDWQHRNLPPTDAEACRQIFLDIHRSAKGDPYLNDLLKAIGYMPFAVTLMATLGKEGQSSAKILLDEWTRTGTDMLSDAANEKSMNKSISLSVDSVLMKRNPEAFTLLATLAMLPAGTTRDRLHLWAPSLKSLPLAIATLSKAGLLMVNDGDAGDSSTLFVLPVVQSYMQLHNRISIEIMLSVRSAYCSYISAHRSRAGDPDFKADAEALGAEDTNIQSIFQGLFSSTNYAATESLESFLVFNWYLHDTIPDVPLAKRALEVSQAAENKKFEAESLFCLGSTYLRLDQFDRSKEPLEQACSSFHDLSKSDPESKSASLSSAGRCGLALALCMQYLMYRESDVLGVLEVAEEDFSVVNDEHGQALCLVGLGKAYSFERNWARALDFLEEARSKLEQFGRRADFASCLNTISEIHYKAEDYTRALAVGEQAWEIVNSLGHELDYLRADITQNLCMTLSQLDRTTEALEYAEISFVNNALTRRPLGVAQVWEAVGSIYLLQSKLEDAHAAYEAAFDLWTSFGSIEMADHGKTLCSENMEMIRLKQEDPSVQVEFQRTTLDWSVGHAAVYI